MKKKVLSALLVAAMTASMVAGCGSSDNKDTQTTGKEGETEDVKLTVWSPQEDQDTKWLQTQCDAFNEAHPEWNITFEYGVCPEGDAKKTVVQDVEGSADVYMLANDNIPELVAAGALAELGGDYKEYVTSTNEATISASVTYNDSVYAFPFTSNTWFMYYDKSAFTEEEAKNLDTMLSKGVVAFPLSNSWYIQAFYLANGCSLFGDGLDEAAGIDFGGDKATAVTNYLVDLAANPNFKNDQDGSGMSGLRDGSIKAIFTGTWDAQNAKEALGDNFGVASLPSITLDGKACQMKSFMGSKAVGVNPNADNPKVAMALAAYLAGEEAQQAHYDVRGILPVNTNIAIKDDEVAAAVSEVTKSASVMQPLLATMSQYWTPAENMGKNLVAGTVTHDTAATETEAMNTAMNTDVAK